MVNPGKRMNILKAKLLSLRHGPGAALLPSEISRIHLDFALRWNDGHLGPRKFWKDCLPRLKFWNPATPMVVNRSSNNAGPAVMSIYFRQAAAGAHPGGGKSSSSSSQTLLAGQPQSSTTGAFPAPPPAEGERVVTIDMKHVPSDAILADFLQKTGATPVQATADELAEMRQIEELRERAAVDRAIMKKFIDDRRNREALLNKAKAEAEAIRLANQ